MDVRTQMEKVIREHSKSPDSRYLETHAVDGLLMFDTAAFVLVEQIDLEYLGGITNNEFSWSVWLMKPGEVEFSRVYEEHAYESQRELCIRLSVEEGELVAFNEDGYMVWSHNPANEVAA